MGTYFRNRALSPVKGAEDAFHSRTPHPGSIRNGKFGPPSQSAQQRQVEVRVKQLADTCGAKQGLDRRDFLKTSSGLAAAFLAMNSVYGKIFDVSKAEAADAGMAAERAESLMNQFIFDIQTHFVRDDYSQEGFLAFLQEGGDIWKTSLAADGQKTSSGQESKPAEEKKGKEKEKWNKFVKKLREFFEKFCIEFKDVKACGYPRLPEAHAEFGHEYFATYDAFEDYVKKYIDVTFSEQKTETASDIDVYLLKFENYVRQIYLGSDTNVSVLSGTPFDNSTWEYLSYEQKAEAANMVNITSGHTRMLSDAVVTPGRPGWMEEVDRLLTERPPASWKLCPIGDPLSPQTEYPFWLDDEKLLYPFYEKAVKAGIVNLVIHKGILPRDYEKSWAGVWEYGTPRDIAKAATDWPQLNFIISHGAFRAFFDKPEDALGDFERTGRIEWCSDLAEIPQHTGLSNIYAAMNTTFASTAIVNPRLTAAILGTWIKGLGASNVVWGTDSVFSGSPQWQIEAMRRMEIPEDMQTKYGFAPLGGADSAIKQQIFGHNSARLYNLDLRTYQRRPSEDKYALI